MFFLLCVVAIGSIRIQSDRGFSSSSDQRAEEDLELDAKPVPPPRRVPVTRSYPPPVSTSPPPIKKNEPPVFPPARKDDSASSPPRSVPIRVPPVAPPPIPEKNDNPIASPVVVQQRMEPPAIVEKVDPPSRPTEPPASTERIDLHSVIREPPSQPPVPDEKEDPPTQNATELVPSQTSVKEPESQEEDDDEEKLELADPPAPENVRSKEDCNGSMQIGICPDGTLEAGQTCFPDNDADLAGTGTIPDGFPIWLLALVGSFLFLVTIADVVVAEFVV